MHHPFSRIPQILKAILLPVFLTLALASLISTPAQAATCKEILKKPPETLWSTPEIYRYLNDINEARCEKLEQEEFDRVVDVMETNMVSYTLLETRLLAGRRGLSDDISKAYLKQYADAGLSLDENAILPLIDIAYYRCRGDTACIQGDVLSQTTNFKLTKLASCLYAMPGKCSPSELPQDYFFLNEETLAGLEKPEAAFTKQKQLVCNRFGGNCGLTATERR